MSKVVINTKTDNNLGKLRGILFKLQLDLDEFKNENCLQSTILLQILLIIAAERNFV